jgi:hypothetical protein
MAGETIRQQKEKVKNEIRTMRRPPFGEDHRKPKTTGQRSNSFSK